MAETLASSDRELNFLQFGVDYASSLSDEISLIGYSSDIVKNTNLEFNIQFTDSDFNCGDLYITIYDISNSQREVLTQSGYLKQCFIQNNNILPVGENYSELISEPGTYEIYIEIFNQQYSENITMTEKLRVK